MAFANSQITDIVATTIQSRSGEAADNVLLNNPMLMRLKQKGNVRPFSGGNVILEELMYVDATTNNINSYSGYETVNITPNSSISAAQFPIVQYAGAVSMSGLEMLQNSSKEAIIDLLTTRVDIAEGELQNRINTDLFLDGTGNNGKNITGLAAAVPDSPVTGIYGGIDRSVWTFWRSQVFSGLTNGGAAVSAANISQYMTAAALKAVRGMDKPDLFVADTNFFQLYVNSLQAIQKVQSTSEAGMGFEAVKFYGGGTSADVVMAGGIGAQATANHMWMLNTKYISFRPHRDRNFVPIGGERQSVNQDAMVKLIGWAGNLTMRGSQFQSLLIA